MVRFSLFTFVLSVTLVCRVDSCASDNLSSMPAYVDTNETDTQESEGKNNQEEDGPTVIEEKTDLTPEEIRKNATVKQEKKGKQLELQDVIESIDESGKVKLKKLPKKEWEELAPTPKDGYDWIQTVYGDWLKGHIRYMYDEVVEFDSQEFGIIKIKFSHIKRMKSYQKMRVNIDNEAIFVGIVDYHDNMITVHSGKNSYTFDKRYIISIATAKEQERFYWSGDMSLDYDLRKGNTDQKNATIKISLDRRTPKSRLSLDYLGRYAEANGERTSEDNRVNLKFDYFLSKYFFVTPFFGEFYQNRFQNIKNQVTLGSGLGYTIIDTHATEWYVACGPAYLRTTYYEVPLHESGIDGSFSFEIRSKYEYDIDSLRKIKTEYKMTFSDKDSGGFRHHFLTKFENDFIKDRIFLDVSFLWDYVKEVQETENYTPLHNDYQLLVGGGVRF